MSKGKSGADQDQDTQSDLNASALLITCDDDDDVVVRRSFRVPVPNAMVSFAFNDQQFEVLDLSMSGLGIRVEDPAMFTAGTVVHDARIIFPDQSFGVDVEVIHVSPYDPQTLVCGMEIIKTLDSGYVDWVSRVIIEIKSSVLSAFKQTSI